MKTQDVIDLAVASGMYQDGDMFFSPATGDADVHISDLEYFAKTVEERTLSKQKSKWYQEGYEAGRHDEREACAKLCDEYHYETGGSCKDAAAAIRARGDKHD